MSDGGLTHLLHFETILAVKSRVLDSPDLVDGDSAVAESDGIVTGSDEVRLKCADDQALDVAIRL